MKPELSIKIDYLKERKNPAEIFEAMALYINAYRDLGQLLSNSVGIKADFSFQLNDIERSSILSKLSSLPGIIDTALEKAFYSSGNDLFRELADIQKTESEDQVDQLAAKMESSLVKNLPQQMADPHVDRKNLALVLNKFSDANKKIAAEETVTFSANEIGHEACRLNTYWRFTGNPEKMFKGNTETKEINDKLYVKVTVNEGHSVWSFKSISLKKSFSARIIDRDWLERYQSGLIQPIGPKDIIEAKIIFDYYTPPKGKGHPSIRNARIISINSITRSINHQYEI